MCLIWHPQRLPWPLGNQHTEKPESSLPGVLVLDLKRAQITPLPAAFKGLCGWAVLPGDVQATHRSSEPPHDMKGRQQPKIC